MRKLYYSLLVFLMGITTASFAQQEATEIQEWDGSNKKMRMSTNTLVTFSYTASADGTLYIYANDQDVSDNVHVSIWGGWYHDGSYDSDSPLQEAGSYENGVGVYAWIRVLAGDEIRFTLSTPEEAEGVMAIFTLRSVLFGNDVKGDSWEQPIELTQNTKVQLPVYKNSDSDYLGELSYATFCRFVAPTDGVASIYTDQYLIYYIEEDLYGSVNEPLKYASQDISTNDHEFIVENGKAYIVILPNSRPTEATFKMTQNGLGGSAQFPKPINALPAVLDLEKGNNYYAFNHELIGNNTMLEVAVAAGWNGTITYLEDRTETSTELAADKVSGMATTFVKNVDTRYLSGNKVIVNFNMEDKNELASAVTLKLRTPKTGESFSTAMKASYGENSIKGPAGDYWFFYTAEMDAVYSFATNGKLKHVNFTAGVEQMVADNVYRVNKGETIYVCVTTTQENGTFTISGEEIVAGDYCDNPVYFELGQDINIKGRGVNNYQSFTAEDDGFAIFQSTNWTLHFREECGTRRLNPEMTIEENGDDIKYAYKLAVAAGKSYIVETETVSEDIIITTRFEGATEGDVCATAIPITASGENINLDYDFEVARWFKYTAEKDGFYIVKAKLGYVGNLSTKIGDCDAIETNAGGDTSMPNYYMGGYQKAKVYVVEGQTLYIYTKTGSENDEEEFGAEFYFSLAYAGEARSGEDVAVAIQAEANKEYTILKNDADGYDQWYTYTIPAGKAATIEFFYTPKTKYTANNLSLLKEDMTSMSSWDGDFTQKNLTNEEGVYGKSMEITVVDQPRKIYVKVGTANAKFYPEPVVWQIICNDNSGIIVEEVTNEVPVIYDLMGRRVENPTKGIYIVNGVKRVIK